MELDNAHRHSDTDESVIELTSDELGCVAGGLVVISIIGQLIGLLNQPPPPTH